MIFRHLCKARRTFQAKGRASLPRGESRRISEQNRSIAKHIEITNAATCRHDMLAGLRVLDLTRVLAGPLCTMMLGDLGANVIKVERPGSGDDTRGWGPPFDDRGESAYFLSVNRNKLSIAADLDDPRDLEVVRSLIKEAQVVVDNFPSG